MFTSCKSLTTFLKISIYNFYYQQYPFVIA